jgi:hypothetical protein
MHSDILACERSAYPVLLECLKHVSHDWRRLQLVNKSMCAAFRHFKQQVDEYTEEREQMRQEAAEMMVMVQLALSDLSRRSTNNGPTLYELMADFEKVVHIMQPSRAGNEVAGLRMPPIIVSVHHTYANNVSAPLASSFVRGFRMVDPESQLDAGAAGQTAVIEVD